MTRRFATAASARRGTSVYVAVMGVGMIVCMVALTTSLTGRLQLRSNQRQGTQVRAQLAAQSGVEFALNWMNRNSDWRTVLTNGVDRAEAGTFGGRFLWRVTDADGDLADDARDHAVLHVTGYDSVRKLSAYAIEVDIEPAGRALTCLESSIHVNVLASISRDASVSGTGIISANEEINGGGNRASIDLDAEAVWKLLGGQYNGNETEGVPAREMPSEHVFDWYVERGTEIKLADIPFSFGSYRFDLQLLSRELNPFGSPDPNGIYWVDCQNNPIDLKWSRFLGTLVLLNAGTSVSYTDVAVYQAAAMNYPALMVQGDLSIDLRSPITGQELREQWIFNYNPDGIPYEGESDSDRTDNRPARIDGIVYATGTITVTDNAIFQGNLIAENLVVNDGRALTVEYRDYAYNYPPPGFSAGQGVRLLPGTFRRVGL
ncbi:MAG: hypothetical protein AAF266_15250 [Planctomycetota bacterium]